MYDILVHHIFIYKITQMKCMTCQSNIFYKLFSFLKTTTSSLFESIQISSFAYTKSIIENENLETN
jgi:hypothetical protein